MQSNEGEFFDVSKEEAEIILAKHKGVVQKNREFIVRHEVEVLAWFLNKIKEFNIVEPVLTNMCEQLTKEYVLKCKKNQASASKLWGSVRI